MGEPWSMRGALGWKEGKSARDADSTFSVRTAEDDTESARSAVEASRGPGVVWGPLHMLTCHNSVTS